MIEFGTGKAGRDEAEADNVQCNRRQKLKIVALLYAVGQPFGLAAIVADLPAEAVQAMLLHREPDFQGPETA